MREASNLFSMSHLQTHSWRLVKYVGKSSLRQRWAHHLENHSHTQKVWPEETVLARLELADSVSKARSTWATPRHGNNMEALGQHAGILPMSSDRSSYAPNSHMTIMTIMIVLFEDSAAHKNCGLGNSCLRSNASCAMYESLTSFPSGPSAAKSNVSILAESGVQES